MPILGSIIKTAIELRSKLPARRKNNPYTKQKITLKKLLRKAQLTSFGETHGFSDILMQTDIIKAFKQSVPIQDYNSLFKNWWYRTLAGEPYVCWPGVVKYFALSSGTSEASSKQIPVTPDMLKAIKKTSIRQILTLGKYDFPNEFFEKGILMLGGSTHLNFNGTYYEGDLSGITTVNIPFWFQHFYKPGKRISRERNWINKLEEIVRKAPEWDIGIISGVPAWVQILLEKIIDAYKLKNIHEIWPNLSIYIHGGVSMSPYYKSFEKLLGKSLTYIETYLASEGFIAYQARPNTNSMELVLDNGMYYEFVPFDDNNFDGDGNLVENPKVLAIDQVTEGEDYAILITNCAGAWRYLIGDTVKFTSKKHAEIIITGRTKHFLNLCGEHMSVDNMNRAVKMLSDEFNIEINEFCVTGYSYERMFAHKWYLGIDQEFDSDLAARKIDDNLKILNDDYRVERLEAIRMVSAEVLPTEVFYSWMATHNRIGSQNKFPRVLKNGKLSDWDAFVKQYKLN
jgi:hypothetical protein